MSGFSQGNVHAGVPTFEEGFQWVAGTTPNGNTILVTPNAAVIDAIICRLEVLEAGAATVTVVKCPPGVSIANGIPISSVTLNCGSTGVALQPISLLQLGATGSLAMKPGDMLALQSTGSFSQSIGTVSIYWHAQ